MGNRRGSDVTEGRKTKWGPQRTDLREEYLNGSTLNEIGQRLGLTRERIRQLIAPISEEEKAESRRKRQERVRVDRDAFREIYKRVGGVKATARELGIPKAQVRRHRGEYFDPVELRIISRSGFKPKETNEEIIANLKMVGEEIGTPFTYDEYDAVAKERDWTRAQTVIHRFDTWAKACSAAGLTSWKPWRKGPYERKWNRRNCLESVKRVAAELDKPYPTADEYDHASKGRDDLPSQATVRMRVGGWTEVMKALWDSNP